MKTTTADSCSGLKDGRGCTPLPEWITLPLAPNGAARSCFDGKAKLPQPILLEGALTLVKDLQEKEQHIAGLDINGPGDPLASLDMTFKIIDQLHKAHPDLALGLTTLGLNLAEHAEELANHGVSRVTLLVNANSSKTAEQLYRWIRPGKRNTPLKEGAATLVDDQIKGVPACLGAGITLAIQTTVYQSINEQEVEDIANTFAALGAESMTILPGKGWTKEEELAIPVISKEIMANLNETAGRHITMHMPPATQKLHECAGHKDCACGSIGLPRPSSARPNVAALSSTGMDIDLHLGQAVKALIYGPRDDGLACLLESRDLPLPGGGEQRWLKLAGVLDDCFCLLAESAGQIPRDILSTKGLPVMLVNDNIEGTVDVLYGGGKKGKCR